MRPSQAMGRGQDFSSADDTDSDVGEDMIMDENVMKMVEEGANALKLESVYWGDSEDDVINSNTDSKEPELANVSLWKCISCKTPMKTSVRLCPKCWNIKKKWAPEKPKRKIKS